MKQDSPVKIIIDFPENKENNPSGKTPSSIIVAGASKYTVNFNY